MEALLKTEYHDFQHGKTGERQIGCDEYSIPASIRPHVDFVTPTIGFSERGRYRKSVRKQVEQVDGNSGRQFALDPYSNQIALAGGSDPSASLANCGRGMTPACIAGRVSSLPCTIYKAIDHSCVYVYTAFLQTIPLTCRPATILVSSNSVKPTKKSAKIMWRPSVKTSC